VPGVASTACIRPSWSSGSRTPRPALVESTEERVSPQQAREDKKRIKELERDLRRKDKALAETAALLVLSKQMEAIFRRGEDE